MRHAMSAIAILVAATAATIAGSSPAAAYDYPYCLQGRGIGIPGECAYSNYAQCMASASGRGLYCNVNPRVAFGTTAATRPDLPGLLTWNSRSASSVSRHM